MEKLSVYSIYYWKNIYTKNPNYFESLISLLMDCPIFSVITLPTMTKFYDTKNGK